MRICHQRGSRLAFPARFSTADFHAHRLHPLRSVGSGGAALGGAQGAGRRGAQRPAGRASFQHRVQDPGAGRGHPAGGAAALSRRNGDHPAARVLGPRSDQRRLRGQPQLLAQARTADDSLRFHHRLQRPVGSFRLQARAARRDGARQGAGAAARGRAQVGSDAAAAAPPAAPAKAGAAASAKSAEPAAKKAERPREAEPAKVVSIDAFRNKK